MDWILLALFVWSAMGAAVTGALFPRDQWYRDLNKPSWTPPDWVFPVSWTLLYACMALAATRIAPLEGSEYAMAFWAVQISFNGLWSPVFFGLKRIRSAMVVARTQCEVAEISYEKFHQIRNQFPDILYAVSRQLGARLRLKGRGLPGKQKGDQFVEAQIVVPPANSQKTRDYYERMRTEFDFDPPRVSDLLRPADLG